MSTILSDIRSEQVWFEGPSISPFCYMHYVRARVIYLFKTWAT